MILPIPVWDRILQSSYNALINFIYADIPKDWNKWSLERRRKWWNDQDLRDRTTELGMTRKRDHISPIEIWCEFYGHSPVEHDQRHIRMLNKTLDSIPTLERVKTAVRCGPYGIQRGFRIL